MSKDLGKLQKQIDDFAKARKWNENLFHTYNMLCNISEETGEIWNVIKWVNTEEDMNLVISKNKEELKDGIGDLLWCIARLAISFDADMFDALSERLTEYEGRFPVNKVLNKKANPSLGGFDGKYQK